MANFKVRGIILKRSNFGEADRILTIFTDKLGKIRALGKGIRKQNSRLGGSLEPFCLGNLVIAEGRNLDIITEAEILECFFELRNNLKSTNLSYYLAEVVDKLTAEHEKHLEVYELLLEVLNNINRVDEKILLSYFELNFLAAVGYYPELDKCLTCSEKILPKDNYFDFNEGGLVCGACHERSGQSISQTSIKLLRLFLNNDLRVIRRIKLKKKEIEEISSVTENYLKHIHQFDFNSRRFLRA